MHGIETIQALNAKAVREAARQPGAKTVKLRADTLAYQEARRWLCYVYNDADGLAADTYAAAWGNTPEQARLRAQQIVDFCDGAIAE